MLLWSIPDMASAGGHLRAPGVQEAGELGDLGFLRGADALGQRLDLRVLCPVGGEFGHLHRLAVVRDHRLGERDVGVVELRTGLSGGRIGRSRAGGGVTDDGSGGVAAAGENRGQDEQPAGEADGYTIGDH